MSAICIIHQCPVTLAWTEPVQIIVHDHFCCWSHEWEWLYLWGTQSARAPESRPWNQDQTHVRVKRHHSENMEVAPNTDIGSLQWPGQEIRRRSSRSVQALLWTLKGPLYHRMGLDFLVWSFMFCLAQCMSGELCKHEPLTNPFHHLILSLDSSYKVSNGCRVVVCCVPETAALTMCMDQWATVQGPVNLKHLRVLVSFNSSYKSRSAPWRIP